MPGSGKSTLGKKLAQSLHVPFFDLDAELEREEGRSVAAIFSEEGEAVFREKEALGLRRLADCKGIVACGGGTPCFHQNMDWMRENGTVIWIQLDEKTLWHRLHQGDGTKRPIWASWPEAEREERLRRMSEQRSAFYSQAHFIYNPLHDSPLQEWITQFFS